MSRLSLLRGFATGVRRWEKADAKLENRRWVLANEISGKARIEVI
jgi:hypothetical protein